MADTYKLQYDGMTLTYPGWNGYVSYESAPAFKTLTLYNSEGGTLTANKLTGYPGDTINLSTAYDTYWRFSGYQLTGDGSLVGNDYTFGNEDASICACYKPNAFTATGEFEKGSDVTCYANSSPDGTRTREVGAKYCTHGAHTGEIPTSWYSTSNIWKPNNASGYSFTMTAKMYFTGHKNKIASYGYTAWCMVGSETSNSQSWTETSPATYSNKLTTTKQNVNYGINAKLGATRKRSNAAQSTYIATGTNGTWVATGYAP